MKFQQSKKGAVLLVAILMASVMLTVGLGVYQRTYKEIYFASFWTQTQRAFLSADTGFECALYRDLHPPVGAVYFIVDSSSITQNTFSCGGSVINISYSIPDDTQLPYIYATSTINVTSSNSYEIKVVKITNSTLGTTATKIISRGYNTADTTNPRRVERGLMMEY